jgi:hypothetical protein
MDTEVDGRVLLKGGIFAAVVDPQLESCIEDFKYLDYELITLRSKDEIGFA